MIESGEIEGIVAAVKQTLVTIQIEKSDPLDRVATMIVTEGDRSICFQIDRHVADRLCHRLAEVFDGSRLQADATDASTRLLKAPKAQ